MDTGSVVSATLLAMLIVLAVGWGAPRVGARIVAADLKRLYMYVGAVAAYAFGLAGSLVAVRQLLNLWLGSARDVRSAADILSEGIALAVVAWPIWLWHLRGAAALSRSRQATALHRSYLYLVALSALVASISFGGLVVAQGVRLLIGTVNLADPWAMPELHSNVATGLVEGGLCAGVWWLAIRAVRDWLGVASTAASSNAGG